MAKNGKPGNGRIGPIKDRSQFKNSAIGGKYTERDKSNGQFLNNKADLKPFKDVRREKPQNGKK
jgi:hypothetical protein